MNDKGTVQISTLVKTVLLALLRLISFCFGYCINKGDTEFGCQSPGKVWNQLWVILGWHTTYPSWKRIRPPALRNHLCYSIHQFISEMAAVFIISYLFTPDCIAPAGKNSTFLSL